MTIILIMLVIFLMLSVSAVLTFIYISATLVITGVILWNYTLAIVLLILLIPPVVRYARAIFFRLRFWHRLKRTCKKYGYTLKRKHPALLSLFFSYKSEDVLIDTGERRFAIKYFPRNVLRRLAHLRGLSLCETAKYYVMPMVITNPFHMILHEKLAKGKFTVNEMIYGKRARKRDIAFKEGFEPILLFSPEPLRLTGLVGRASKPLGSGEYYEGVTLYEDQA